MPGMAKQSACHLQTIQVDFPVPCPCNWNPQTPGGLQGSLIGQGPTVRYLNLSDGVLLGTPYVTMASVASVASVLPPCCLHVCCTLARAMDLGFTG